MKDNVKNSKNDDEANNRKKNQHDGHRERVRQKFLKNGLESFEEHEILELLLFYSIPRINTNEIAHNLLETFDSLKGVCNADIKDLMKIDGISERSAILIKLVPALSRAYSAPLKKHVKFSNTKIICDYFINRFLGETKEKVRVVCLNDKLTHVNEKVINEGVPGKVDINIRKIVEFTYQNNCEDIIIAHNHPNGDPIPSNEDIKATREMYKILKPIGINLLDHIIVADNQAISLKETGAFSLLR